MSPTPPEDGSEEPQETVADPLVSDPPTNDLTLQGEPPKDSPAPSGKQVDGGEEPVICQDTTPEIESSSPPPPEDSEESEEDTESGAETPYSSPNETEPASPEDNTGADKADAALDIVDQSVEKDGVVCVHVETLADTSIDEASNPQDIQVESEPASSLLEKGGDALVPDELPRDSKEVAESVDNVAATLEEQKPEQTKDSQAPGVLDEAAAALLESKGEKVTREQPADEASEEASVSLQSGPPAVTEEQSPAVTEEEKAAASLDSKDGEDKEVGAADVLKDPWAVTNDDDAAPAVEDPPKTVRGRSKSQSLPLKPGDTFVPDPEKLKPFVLDLKPLVDASAGKEETSEEVKADAEEGSEEQKPDTEDSEKKEEEDSEKEEKEESEEEEEAEAKPEPEPEPEPVKKHNPFDVADGDDDAKSDSEEEDVAAPETDVASPAAEKDASLDQEAKKPKKPKTNILSPAEQEWVRQKKELGDKNAALDRLMGMVGLEEVKLEFLKIKALIEAARDRKGRLRRDDLNLVLLGNAGTGKRTIARIYQDFLLECGVWPDLGDGAKPELISKTGYQLRGSSKCADFANLLVSSREREKFVVIDGIDVIEPYYMAQVLDAIDRKSTKLVTVLMGDVKASTKSLGARPHGRWLFRRRLELKDYDEEQLRVILLRLIRRNALKVEGGEDGPYPRVVAKRVARSRGSPGFGNVHDLMIAFEKVLDRQSLRLDKVRTKPVEEPPKEEAASADGKDEAAAGDDGTQEVSEKESSAETSEPTDKKDTPKDETPKDETPPEHPKSKDGETLPEDVPRQETSTEETEPNITESSPEDATQQGTSTEEGQITKEAESADNATQAEESPQTSTSAVVAESTNDETIPADVSGQETLTTEAEIKPDETPTEGASVDHTAAGEAEMPAQEILSEGLSDPAGSTNGDGKADDQNRGISTEKETTSNEPTDETTQDSAPVMSVEEGKEPTSLSPVEKNESLGQEVAVQKTASEGPEKTEKHSDQETSAVEVDLGDKNTTTDDQTSGTNKAEGNADVKETILPDTSGEKKDEEITDGHDKQEKDAVSPDRVDLLPGAEKKKVDAADDKDQKETTSPDEDGSPKDKQTNVEETPSPTFEDKAVEQPSIAQKQPEDVFLTMEDMIGPAPPDIRTESETWKELSSMIGLDDVKKAIGQLLDRAKENYRRETQLKEPLKTSLNRVFLGPPGTGKTTVAQLYGKLVGELGLLSTREVVMTTPGDYIGQYIGESEAKTSAILDSTVGKILIIDDAHMFFGGSRPGSGSHSSDIFRLGCIDTLISRIHNKPGDDRCVILLGYTAQMEEMFQKVNPGLRRRFPLEEAFRFEDYDDKQLHDILRHKMAKEEITASEPAMEVAAEVLRRARDRPNFGNGGDVENLLNQAKTRLRERHKKALLEGVKLDNEEEDTLSLTREDFDPEWDRGCHASQRIKSLFDGLIGFDSVVDKFKGYQTMAARMRARGRDPKTLIPFSYVFKGPPGTGKTHTARIVGQIFYDMGFLSTTEVVECSASNLIGKYCGHTAPKVVDLFERGLGKVVFIDEAYRLSPSGGGGHNKSFEEEAIGEIVDCMTKPQFYRKLVVVLAGYDHDMEDLMKVNAGLRSRFATDIVFPCMTPVRSRMHLLSLLENEDIEVWDAVEQTAEEKEVVLKLFHRLGKTPGWANARDVKTLAGQVTIRAYTKGGGAGDDNDDGTAEGGKLRISTKDLVVSMKEMLKQRLKC